MNTHSQKTPRVCILLSTYNGERFIAEQLDSLLHQTYPNIHIHIRDDGSTDDTVKIIKSYGKVHNNIFITEGENCGIVHSFIKILKDTNNPSGLYAFCDQDDIWLSHKAEVAVSAIMDSQTPSKTLYCTRLEYTDQDMGHLGYSRIPKQIGFNNAIVENIAVGCTSVFGEDIKRLVLQADPNTMMMHDWWTYLAAASFGEVVFDSRTSIKYRQHGNSATPWEPGLKKIKARAYGLVNRLLNHRHAGLDSLNQAIKFIETYPETATKNTDLIRQLVDMRGKRTLLKRLRYIYNPQVVRSDPIENLLLKPMILFRLH